jgi:hypothetical protein
MPKTIRICRTNPTAYTHDIIMHLLSHLDTLWLRLWQGRAAHYNENFPLINRHHVFPMQWFYVVVSRVYSGAL